MRINEDQRELYILDDYDENDYLLPELPELIIVILYFVVLSCDSLLTDCRRDYLLLDYEGYVDANIYEKNRKTIWSVPYITVACHPDGWKRLSKVIDIRNYYKQQLHERERDFAVMEEQLMYKLGVFDGKITEGDSYIEYKQSTTQPDRWKTYFIQEKFLTDVGPKGILNLVDPEGLKMHRYFPLSSTIRRRKNSFSW